MPQHNYPDPTYLGETGEISATYRPADVAPELMYPNGTAVHYLATGKTTRGTFGLYRWESAPASGGPGPHFHRTINESFYVLAGTIKIYDGRRWIDARAGDFVHVPEGGLHGFRNESDQPAAMLIHFAPGAPREAYFEGNARFAREGSPAADVLEEFRRLHDNYFVDAG
jgi:mannose-6-phosphate isomerase-like protein (cupin superfamily)